MKLSITPSNDDFNYYLSQGSAETARIVSGMLSIIEANEEKLSIMQNQKWFQRMWLTVSGKNKATVREMEQNRDKLAAYSVQVIAKLIEEKAISQGIISNITVRLNEIYLSNLQLKEVMYEFVNKLNEKIDSVDDYQNLITDIQNNKYRNKKLFVSLLEILSFLDKRTVSDKKRLLRIKETMETQGFIFSQSVSIIEFTEQIFVLPEETVGQIYLFTQNHTELKFIQFACCLIEQYHFEPKSNRRIIKERAVKTALETCGLNGDERCNIDELYDDIENSTREKFAMLQEFPTPKIDDPLITEKNTGEIRDEPSSDNPTVGEKTSSGEPEGKNVKSKTNLDILDEFSNEELEVLVRLIIDKGTFMGKRTEKLSTDGSYIKYYPNHKRYVDKIKQALIDFGSNEIKVLLGKKATYHKILVDVCKKTKVNFNEKSPLEHIEKALLGKVLVDAWDKMSAAEKEELLKDGAQNCGRGEFTAEALIAILGAGGFAAYRLAANIANAVAISVVGSGLPFAAKVVIGRGLGNIAGPIGLVLTALFTVVYDIAGPAYRITVPAVIYIAALRQVYQSEHKVTR